MNQIQQLFDEADEQGELEKKKELSLLLTEKKKILFDHEQEVLMDMLPSAFAVVKNGCRRLMGKSFWFEERK